MAQLGVTIAGFAGVVAVFREGPDWTALQSFRLRVLVQTSLGVMFTALLPLVFRSAFGEDGLAIRWASGVAAFWMVFMTAQLQRQMARTRALGLLSRTNLTGLIPAGATLALLAVNVIVPDPTRYIAALLLVLFSAAVAFQRLIGVRGR